MNQVTFEILRAVHLIALVVWFGSALSAARTLRTHSSAEGESAKTIRRMMSREITGSVVGLALAVGSGVLLLVPNAAHYMGQGLFHLKLTLGVVAIVLTLLLFVKIQKASDGSSRGPLPMIVHGILGLILAVVVILTTVAITSP